MKPTTLDEVLRTYRGHGHLHYGEDVTWLEELCRCCKRLSELAHEW
jgi:hypothetical protein